MKILLVLLALLSQSSFAADPLPTYHDFILQADQHREVVDNEGAAYMIGGGAALGLSLGLGVYSTDPFSKVGYTLIEALSSAAVFYGASLRLVGDEFTQRAESLRFLEAELGRNGKLSLAEKTKILDDATRYAVWSARVRNLKIRRTRGYLEVTTAASSLVSLGFARVTTTASNVALGFVFVISSAGGLSDLFTDGDSSFSNFGDPDTAKKVTVGPSWLNGAGQIALTCRF